jgi:putative nucleotidyltransferase with HDIG domain
MSTDLDTSLIRNRLKNVQSLPTLPPIAAKLNKMVEDEDITAAAIEAVIAKDQAMTTKLLKIVNSPFFGFPQRVSTISNAIVLLGFNVIRTLIVTSSIFETMQSSDISLWEHSLGCAACAGILAKRKKLKSPEEVSTAGLIHDLGKVVIRAEFPEKFVEIQKIVEAEQIPMREAEIKCIGIGHAEIGSELAKLWNLPQRLIEPIKHHHDINDNLIFKDITAIIHFSDILVRGLGFGSGGDPWVPDLDEKAWKIIKIGKNDLKEILEEMDSKIVELQDFAMEMQK